MEKFILSGVVDGSAITPERYLTLRIKIKNIEFGNSSLGGFVSQMLSLSNTVIRRVKQLILMGRDDCGPSGTLFR